MNDNISRPNAWFWSEFRNVNVWNLALLGESKYISSNTVHVRHLCSYVTLGKYVLWYCMQLKIQIPAHLSNLVLHASHASHASQPLPRQ